MGKIKDLTGQKFGRLTAVETTGWYINPTTGRKRAKWLCCCECGEKKNFRENNLTSGHTQSCGQCGYGRGSKSKFTSQFTGGIGKRAENQVSEMCAGQGWEVYVPYCEAGKVDLRVDAGQGWRRVQVKGTTTSHFCAKLKKYPPGTIDLFVFYQLKSREIFIVPARTASLNSPSLKQLTEYKNAWHFFTCPSTSYEATKEWAESLKKEKSHARDDETNNT